MDTPTPVQTPSNSDAWKKGLIIFSVIIAVAAVIIGSLFGAGVIGGKDIEGDGEITKNSGLFLVSMVTDKNFGLIVPILISQNQSNNTGIAKEWISVGSKMGITPSFDEQTNTYKLNISDDLKKYIQTITFVSTPNFDIIPGTVKQIGNKMYTYLVLGGLNKNNICLYTLGEGVCPDLVTYEFIEENPIGYDDLKNMAFKSISEQGFCVPNYKPSGCIPEIPK